jgi:hypothetical protein
MVHHTASSLSRFTYIDSSNCPVENKTLSETLILTSYLSSAYGSMMQVSLIHYAKTKVGVVIKSHEVSKE